MSKISLPHDHPMIQARWVCGADGSRLPDRTSTYTLAEEPAEEPDERFRRLEFIRNTLVEACGGEDAYERLVAMIDGP